MKDWPVMPYPHTNLKDGLISFEKEVARRFEAGDIRGPVHLSGGNEDQLIEIFENIHEDDWVFSSWRNHYHALLHGIPPEELMSKIIAGHSMNIFDKDRHFFTSSIVGGTLPIALGVAMGMWRSGSPDHVWVFVGDMTAATGIFHEVNQYVSARNYLESKEKLPITFIVEDNGLSTDTPTEAAWGRFLPKIGFNIIRYSYKRTWPHVNSGKWVSF